VTSYSYRIYFEYNEDADEEADYDNAVLPYSMLYTVSFHVMHARLDYGSYLINLAVNVSVYILFSFFVDGSCITVFKVIQFFLRSKGYNI